MSKTNNLSFVVNDALNAELEKVVQNNPELTKSQVCREGLRRELQKYEL